MQRLSEIQAAANAETERTIWRARRALAFAGLLCAVFVLVLVLAFASDWVVWCCLFWVAFAAKRAGGYL